MHRLLKKIISISFITLGLSAAIVFIYIHNVQAKNSLVSIESATVSTTTKENETNVSTELHHTKHARLSAAINLSSSEPGTTLAAEQDLSLALQNASLYASTTIRGDIDSFFINPDSSNPELQITSSTTFEMSIESGRVEVGHRLQDLQALALSASSTSITSDDLEHISDQVKDDLGEIKLFLDNIAVNTNSLTPDALLSTSTITLWNNNVSESLTGINNAMTAIFAADVEMKQAESLYIATSTTI